MKNLSKLGKALNKAEQKEINGGGRSLNGGSNGGCSNGYYTCADGTQIYVGPCNWPHFVPCY